LKSSHSTRPTASRAATRRPNLSCQRLDALVAEATVDAYGDDEQLTVERVMRKKLARIKTSVPAAMERLQRIRVGRATVGQQTVPFLTNVSKPARECYEHLGVSIPRVADVAEVVTANL
jgi:hypothetical protein